MKPARPVAIIGNSHTSAEMALHGAGVAGDSSLVGGVPFWPAHDAVQPTYPAIDRDVRCDVAIVGAGITGALVAHAMVEAGIDAVLIERDRIARCSTAANTALVLYELDTPLHELASMIGEERATRAYQLCVRAVHEAGRLAGELGGDCGYAPRESIYLASEEADVVGLQREVTARRRAGIRVDYLDARDVAATFPFRRAGAIRSYDAAQLDPFRTAHRLIERSAARGLRVFEHTNIDARGANREGVRLITASGNSVRAPWVIYASGYATEAGVPNPPADTHTTYATVSEPLTYFAGWPGQCLIWETARPYLYLRMTSDGRAMIGGEDDADLSPPSPARLARKRDALVEKFNALFPDIGFRPAATWSGLFKTTRDGLPYIGAHPEHPRALFALGYGGNGMTFSIIAAEILRDLCMGRTNRDAELFGFGR